MKKFLLFFILLMPVFSVAHAQISVQHKGTLKELFTILTKKYKYNFMYSNNDINDQQKININVKNVSLNTVLSEVSKTVNISYRIINKQVILKKGEKPKVQDKEKNIAITDEEKPPQTPTPKNSSELKKAEQNEIKTPEQAIPDTVIFNPSVITANTPEIIAAPKNDLSTIEGEATKQPQTNNKQIENNTHTTKDNKNEPIKNNRSYEFSLYTNLLYDVALTPNLSIEFKPNDNIGILAGGMWSHINWGDGDKSYRIWAVNPEIRYYISNSPFYAGAMFTIGELNFKLSKTGYQGDFMGGGLTTGYLLQLNNRLSFDFGLGLGCTHYKYDKYEFINNTNLRTGSDTKNLWGLTKASVSLMFKISK